MSKLLRPVFGILFLLGLINVSFGQAAQFRPSPVLRNAQVNRPKNQAGNKLERVKENFIKRQLNLTAEQNSKFMPMYRRYQQEVTAVKIAIRLNSSSASTNGTEQIDREMALQTELLNIRKHYRDEFLKIMSASKVSEIYKAESEFNDEVLNQLKERSVRAGD